MKDNSSKYLVCYPGLLILIIAFSSVIIGQTQSDGATPKMTQPGAPAGSYALSGFESVNLFNGNLNFNLTLAKIGGRGKAGSSVNLAIDSVRWQVERSALTQERTVLNSIGSLRIADAAGFYACICPHCEDPLGRHQFPPDPREIDTWDCGNPNTGSNELVVSGWTSDVPGLGFDTYDVYEDKLTPKPGYGPGVVFGRGASHGGMMSHFYSMLTRLYFVSSDGTEYELRDELTGGKPFFGGTAQNPNGRGTAFSSADGSGIKFVSDTPISENRQTALGSVRFRVSGYLYFPDGSRARIDNGNFTWNRDTNGNRITYTYNTANQVTNIFDSLGRETRII